MYNFFNDAIGHLQSQRAPSKIGSMSDLVGSTNSNGNNIIEALSFTPRPSSSEYMYANVNKLGRNKLIFNPFKLNT